MKSSCAVVIVFCVAFVASQSLDQHAHQRAIAKRSIVGSIMHNLQSLTRTLTGQNATEGDTEAARSDGGHAHKAKRSIEHLKTLESVLVGSSDKLHEMFKTLHSTTTTQEKPQATAVVGTPHALNNILLQPLNILHNGGHHGIFRPVVHVNKPVVEVVPPTVVQPVNVVVPAAEVVVPPAQVLIDPRQNPVVATTSEASPTTEAVSTEANPTSPAGTTQAPSATTVTEGSSTTHTGSTWATETSTDVVPWATTASAVSQPPNEVAREDFQIA